MKVAPRTTALVFALLAVGGAYVGRDAILAHLEDKPAPASAFPPPLPGTSAISGAVVKRDQRGRWVVEFDYFFTGVPRMSRFIIATLPNLWGNDSDAGALSAGGPLLRPPARGQHHAVFEIPYPGRAGITTHVKVGLGSMVGGGSTFASQQVEQTIDWPTGETWQVESELAREPAEATLKQAVVLIDRDEEQWLPRAKVLLEKLIERDARFEPAYVELARVTMKNNWGPEGLHQAETLLLTAREIRPEDANAKILLGYVYANQRQFTKAEALFEDAARSNPPNQWLWVNWGQLLVMQGKYDEATAKYRDVLSRPAPHDSNDRARKSAYTSVIKLLERRKDLDGMEAMYQQRIDEFGPGACFSAEYARFLLETRGKPDAAIQLAHRALNQNCNDAPAREVLGVAEYVIWASETGAASSEALNQAHIYLPMSATALCALAKGERSSTALKPLIDSGEKIDQQDNEHMTALAHALADNDLVAARRLLALGARPDLSVTLAEIPLALVPVLEGRLDAVQLLQRYGVDYKKLRYQGATAFEIARQSGNPAILAAMTGKAVSL